MRYFGTDGIRGKYNEFITKELAYKLGRSLISLNCNKVVIGGDTRESTNVLIEYLSYGCKSVGIEVINAGVVPTAAIIYYSKINNICGVMITASHNPYYDNGLKVVNKGIKLSLVEELLIESIICNDISIEKYSINDIDNSVLDLYLKLIRNYSTKINLNVLIDCANGSTSVTAPQVLKEVCNLKVVNNNPNGVNINDCCGSTYINKYIDNMNDNDIIFTFDGDGDRILVIENNKIINGDQIIFIIAKYLHENNVLNNNTVVLTKMSNIGILNKLNSLNINYVLTDVGDKNVVKELLDNNYSIGGETSGHIILPQILSTGDGLLVCMLLLKIMKEKKSSLSKMIEDIEMYYDEMLNLKCMNTDFLKDKVFIDKIESINNQIDGKVIVRKSGTEDLIRLSVMARNKEDVKKYITEIVELIGG